MKVKLDKDKCIGCALCENICPKVFKMDPKSGKSKVISPSTTEKCAQEAAEQCPVQCITVSK